MSNFMSTNLKIKTKLIYKNITAQLTQKNRKIR